MEQDPIDQFKAIFTARERLDDDITAASSHMRDAFVTAAERARVLEAELAVNPVVREYFRGLGSAAVSASLELDQYKSDIKKLQTEYLPLGLVDEATLAEKQAEIAQMEAKAIAASLDPVLKIAEYFISTYAAQTEETEIPPPTATPDKTAEVSQQPTIPSETLTETTRIIPVDEAAKVAKPTIQIQLKDHDLYVGEFKIAALPKDDRTEWYSLRAIKALINNQGQMINANKLWREVSGSDASIDHSGRDVVRKWLKSLECNGVQIVTTAGVKRGSSYGIVSFDVYFKESAADSIIPDKETAIIRAEVQESVADQPDTSVDAVAGTLIEASANKNMLEVDKLLPIEQAAIAAAFLAFYKNIFEQTGSDVMQNDMLDRLNEAVIAKGGFGTRTDEELRILRTDTLERIRKIFDNSWILEEMIDRLPAHDPRIDLIAYMMDINSNECWELIDQVASARNEQEVDIIYSRKGFEIRDIRLLTVTQEGKILHITQEESVTAEHNLLAGDSAAEVVVSIDKVSTRAAVESPKLDDPEESEVEIPSPKSADEVLNMTESTDNVVAETAVQSPVSTRIESLQNDTRKIVRETLHLARVNSLAGSRRAQLEAVFRYMNTRFVRNARENNIVGPENRVNGYGIEDIVKLRLLHDFPDEYRTKRLRREIDRVAKEEMKRYEEKNSENNKG